MRDVDGGCDHGYASTACLWGTDPEPLLDELVRRYDVTGCRVLDAGCGEGRNAVRLARLGAAVTAVDVSTLALRNAAAAWPDEPGVEWRQADLVRDPPAGEYDVVVCDSVLHWLVGREEVVGLTTALRAATRPGGYHLVCSFNDRMQQLDGHERPPRCILPHADLLALYAGWTLVEVRDEDIVSAHAGAPEPHSHTVTKILARSPAGGDRS